MDSLSQALLGAAAAQCGYRRSLGRAATWLGAAGGLLADADFLVVALADLPFPEMYHRHFSHALLAIPVGGPLAALPFLAWKPMRQRARAVVGAATLGYATHALMDACTSYGTHLGLPFSQARVAWDCLPIVDPLPSLALFAGVLLSHRSARRLPALLGILFLVLYALVGRVQHDRVEAAQFRLAASRGDVVDHARAMPQPGGLFFWRGVYRAGGRIHVDHYRAPLFGPVGFRPVGTVRHLDPDEVPGVERDARLKPVLEIFERFADGMTGPIPDRPGTLGDFRISPSSDLSPLRALEITPGGRHPTRYVPRPGDADRGKLIGALRDAFTGKGYEEVPDHD